MNERERETNPSSSARRVLLLRLLTHNVYIYFDTHKKNTHEYYY